MTPNIGHFCDPERNHHKVDDWPWHDACRGKEIINFGLGNEQVVNCECPCHNNKEEENKK
jgi:hypothetical protein